MVNVQYNAKNQEEFDFLKKNMEELLKSYDINCIGGIKVEKGISVRRPKAIQISPVSDLDKITGVIQTGKNGLGLFVKSGPGYLMIDFKDVSYWIDYSFRKF